MDIESKWKEFFNAKHCEMPVDTCVYYRDKIKQLIKHNKQHDAVILLSEAMSIGYPNSRLNDIIYSTIEYAAVYVLNFILINCHSKIDINKLDDSRINTPLTYGVARLMNEPTNCNRYKILLDLLYAGANPFIKDATDLNCFELFRNAEDKLEKFIVRFNAVKTNSYLTDIRYRHAQFLKACCDIADVPFSMCNILDLSYNELTDIPVNGYWSLQMESLTYYAESCLTEKLSATKGENAWQDIWNG